MKEPYDEGLANHIGPAPCVAAREGTGEASERGCVGWVLRPAKATFEAPTLWVSGEGNTVRDAMASPDAGLAWS